MIMMIQKSFSLVPNGLRAKSIRAMTGRDMATSPIMMAVRSDRPKISMINDFELVICLTRKTLELLWMDVL